MLKETLHIGPRLPLVPFLLLFQLHVSPLDPHVPHETWGLGVENFISFQTHMRGCAFVRGAEGWQKAPWAVQCPFKKMGFGQSPNYPAHSVT